MSDIEVISPLPGVFYRQPSPEAPPFVEAGDKVTPDTVIGLIEVMKQFSEIFAETRGTITAITIQNGDGVEPGQVLAIIKTDNE
ncbi:Acetyl-CoA carboxylase, bitoin carboxyl carrier protein [Enterobacter sp. FY-07]|uniref:acetyl-CoA carboxylase n=1 Tax=Kosakonia oryzendophytica TaxID=1005665 RepID=UPI000777D1E1|nr:acetyl-CoA carboxylase [Kosakonia oryzendophytica]AMO48297.1 Acetyl-CoA carboxylase, bitoin carboxyl carrier protein [Enterobacter sp. FY-07]WBT59941.1 acetyl-CoA carboxylase [Kosakonia oryzendophytica]